MRLAAVEIYNEITGYWMWPFGAPDIEKVIDRSMKRVARLISKDYRAPIKVECCGFTIFRCCCRKSNPRSNLLHNIVDGMEDRERSMMHSRGIDEYNTTRGRNSKYLLEDDAYEAEQQLKYLESDQYLENGMGHYDNENTQESYYSEDYSRGSFSRDSRDAGDQQTVFTEAGDSYARGIGAGAYDASRSHGERSGGDYFQGETLTQSSERGWDDASESQYGY